MAKMRRRRPHVGFRRGIGKGRHPAHGNNLHDRGNAASIMWQGTGRATGR
jgi:hypothetical protein